MHASYVIVRPHTGNFEIGSQATLDIKTRSTKDGENDKHGIVHLRADDSSQLLQRDHTCASVLPDLAKYIRSLDVDVDLEVFTRI